MRKLVSIALLVFITALSTQAQENVHFRVNPKQGQTIQYTMLIKTDIEGAQGLMIDMYIDMNLTPILVSDSTINIEAKYTKVRVDGAADEQLFSYDSSKDSQDMEISQALSSIIGPLLQNTLTLVMDRSGFVKSIDLPNVSEQAFDKSSMEGLSPNFPNNAIAIGDSWKSTKTTAQLDSKVETTNTFVEKTANGYKIATTGIYYNPEGAESGKMDGYYIVDLNTHFTNSSLVNTTINLYGQEISMSVELKRTN